MLISVPSRLERCWIGEMGEALALDWILLESLSLLNIMAALNLHA